MTPNPWESFPSGLDPLAPNTGPFPRAPFLEAVWNYRDTRDLDLHIEVVDEGAVGLVVSDGLVEFAGQSNLTDYHSPVGPGASRAIAAALAKHPGKSFHFDSLPEEVVPAVETAVAMADAESVTERHATTAVLSLPSTYEEWLASIGKKERHEVRRKRRRFTAEFGEIKVVRNGSDAIDMFCAMHRTSHGEKGTFMTDKMQRYFEELIVSSGASIHTLTCDEIPRANAFGFETGEGYFFYNSAYDIDASMASPGIVLLASMIEAQIERGARVFDFLKGSERYKFKHGAAPRPLYAVSGQMP